MIVMKFGGTSVGSGDMIRNAVGIIAKNSSRSPIVVVSAFSKATDLLLKASREAETGIFDSSFEAVVKRHFLVIDDLGLDRNLISSELDGLRSALAAVASAGKCSRRDSDLIASYGERMSAKIIAEFGKRRGLSMRAYNSFDIGMVTDSGFGHAEILPESYSILRSFFSSLQGEIPVVTGFIARSKHGEITTLGRGGSDYSASIIGSAVDAEEVQIWTDVDGVMTADPRIVPDAMTIPEVSFGEISQLAYFGAKVLHPKTIIPVMDRNIRVRVLNTFNPEGSGTAIVSRKSNSGITSIACKKAISVISISSARMFLMHGFLHKIFKIFDEHKVSVDMISTSEVSVSVTLDSRSVDIVALQHELGLIADVSVEGSRASVCVVGAGIKRTPGISAVVFGALAEKGINVEMISQGASEINIGLVVREGDADEAVSALHNVFFGGWKK